MSATANEALDLTCPFCGSLDIVRSGCVVEVDGQDGLACECANCGGLGPGGIGEEGAAAAWNRRAPIAAESTAAQCAYQHAMQAAGVPHEPLQVYDSNSFRRVGLASQYREVMWPTTQRDGHPDISGTDVLRAMVAAFNAMLEGRARTSKP